MAYWLIGREIVQALQGGEARAEYGSQMMEELSARLAARCGKGFYTTNLWYFRQFYQAYADRLQHRMPPLGGGSDPANLPSEILHPPGGELANAPVFHPNLSWSHYRALMRVDHDNAAQEKQTPGRSNPTSTWNSRACQGAHAAASDRL